MRCWSSSPKSSRRSRRRPRERRASASHTGRPAAVATAFNSSRAFRASSHSPPPARASARPRWIISARGDFGSFFHASRKLPDASLNRAAPFSFMAVAARRRHSPIHAVARASHIGRALPTSTAEATPRNSASASSQRPARKASMPRTKVAGSSANFREAISEAGRDWTGLVLPFHSTLS